MYVSGNASTHRSSPMRDSATSALSRPLRSVSPRRRASSTTTSSPTLWRVRAYSLPGLPSPTTSQSNGVERRLTRRCRQTSRHPTTLRLQRLAGRGFARPRPRPPACSSAASASAASISAISARIVSTVTIGLSGSPVGPDTGRHRQVLEADDTVHLHLGDVDDELVRDRPRRRHDLDGVDCRVDEAAALDDCRRLTLEAQRHRHA